MGNLMKDIVNSDAVQNLLDDVQIAIEMGQITETEFKKVCVAVQKKINSDESLLLEPLEVAMLIEDALIIHSAMRVRAESKRDKHFMNPEKSVEVAFYKQFGPQKTMTLN